MGVKYENINSSNYRGCCRYCVPADLQKNTGAKKMSEFNQTKYINDFMKEKYDRIGLMVPKGQKEIIKERAKNKNMSVNEFINSLIRAELNK